MDLKQYFRKIREIEASLVDEFPLVVSLETSDGGKGGEFAELTRSNAARMIAEGRATLASQEQIERFKEQQAAAKKAAERAEFAKRIQLAIVSDPDVQPTTLGKRNSGSPNNGK